MSASSLQRGGLPDVAYHGITARTVGTKEISGSNRENVLPEQWATRSMTRQMAPEAHKIP